MPILLIFSTSFLVGLSGALTPGPLLIVDVAEAVQGGFWAGPRVATGHAGVEMVLVVALVRGLSGVAQRSRVAGGIAVAGGVVLIALGAMTMADARTLSLAAAVEGRGVGSLGMGGGVGPFWAGALATLANPYWIIWWATVGTTYTLRALEWGVAGVVAFYVGHVLADYGWYSLVAAIVAGGRQLLSDEVYQGLLMTCGLFLMGLGASFVWSGAAFWRGRSTRVDG